MENNIKIEVDNHQLSQESYDRIFSVVGIPDEYLKGKVCTYDIIHKIDREFSYNIDQPYLKDYFLIQDWVKFSFYTGHIFQNFFKNDIYKEIPIENIELMWNAFNQNKKEKNGKSSDYYEGKRYYYIPQLISLLLKKSRKYDPQKSLLLLKEMVSNLDEDKDIKNNDSLARNNATFMGDYLISNKCMDKNILDFLKEKQNINTMNISLIFYDWKINKIQQEEKLELLFNLIKKQKQEITDTDIVKQSIDTNAFNMIKYMNSKHNYVFNEKEIELIIKNQKDLYNHDNVQYIIENFSSEKLVAKVFHKLYQGYRYSEKINEEQFYNNNIEYLKKKISHSELADKLKFKNNHTKINKI